MGWAFKCEQRARQFNHAEMPCLGGLECKPILFQFWDTARKTYAVAQRLLSLLSDKLHADNSEIVFELTEDELSGVLIDIALGEQTGRRIDN